MGIPAALKAHRDGDFKNAALHYQRALDQEDYKPILFQNYGALLRDCGDVVKAESVYKVGLKLHPDHRGIRLNYANLIRRDRPIEAFGLHLCLLQEKIRDGNSAIAASEIFPLVDILENFGFYAWAYQIVRWALANFEAHPSLLLLLFRVSTASKASLLTRAEQSDLSLILEKCLADFSSVDQAEYYFSLAFLQSNRKEFSLSKSSLAKARSLLTSSTFNSIKDHEKAKKLNNMSSWNLGCTLLTHQEFAEGWRLFEYGMLTEAKGGQKWQRAMPKPFTNKDCPLWRGESLVDKKILLLEEQAIGDIMQFITLVPLLLKETKNISILLGNRLLPVYKRAFQSEIAAGYLTLYSFDDVSSSKCYSSLFDYQSPLGSVCQYRFTDIKLFGTSLPILKSDPSLRNHLRAKYLESCNTNTPLIGISWKGGGRADRIKQKSIPVDDFKDFLLSLKGVRFVSIQYGDVKPTIVKWNSQGLNVIYDESINPMKDMDSWHAQVEACDAVISVANTTIHGAGGLNIPTQCLLSQDSDWRWLIDQSVMRSYWYPSVGIARQSVNGDWNSAFSLIRRWVADGVQFPSGRISC